jgi:hydrogenase maturation protease
VSRVVVACYGNPLRQDDGAAWRVAEAISARWSTDPGVRVLRDVQPLPEWAADLAEAEVAYFVDAAPLGERRFGVRLTCLRPAAAPLGELGRLGGHAAGPEALLALARALYSRAPRAYLLSIPAARFGVDDGLSELTAAAVPLAVALLERRLAEVAPCA